MKQISSTFIVITALLATFHIGLATTHAQVEGFVFKKITSLDGLSQNDINSIYQDENGFMWFGTNDGLNRYDGYGFKMVGYSDNVRNRLSSQLIHRISGDKNGRLFIGTTDNGLNILNLKSGTITVPKDPTTDKPYFSTTNVQGMASDQKQNQWICSDEQMVFIPANKPDSIINFNTPRQLGLNSFKETKLVMDAKDQLWLLCEDGLYMIAKGAQKAKQISAFTCRPFTIIDSPIGVLYTTNQGLFLVKKDGHIEHISSLTSSRMLVDRNSFLWVVQSTGLTRYKIDKDGKRTGRLRFSWGDKTYNISSNVITSLYEDNIGQIWIGTRAGGVNVFNPYRKKFETYRHLFPEYPHDTKISDIYEDDQRNLWITSEGTGIVMYPPQNARTFKEPAIQIPLAKNQNYVYRIKKIRLPNRKKTYIFSSKAGLHCIKNKGPEIELPDIKAIMFDMVQDKKGVLWCAYHGQGLVRFDPFGRIPYKQFLRDSSKIPSNVLRSLCFDKNGNLWIGSKKGLLKISKIDLYSDDPDFLVLQHDPNNPTSISNNYILPIIETSDKNMYIGTLGGGINKLIKTINGGYAFKHITTNEGLPNNVIKSIVEDEDGNLWISTNRGLCVMDTDSFRIKTFGTQDGLQDYEFSEMASQRLRDGRILFGGVKGINIFRPSKIKGHNALASVVLTEFKILNQSIHAGQVFNGRKILSNNIEYANEILLKHKENSFSVAFSPMHLAAPTTNKAKYRLLGFEDQWNEVTGTNGVAKYTNIRAGKYILEIKAANGDNLWNEQPRTLHIQVKRPFLTSIPMILLYMAIFTASVMFFMKYSFIRNKRKHELEMEEFEVKKMQELSNMKLRFFTNISHEFRTPITLLINPLEDLMNRTEAPDFKSLKRITNLMYRNASLLLRLVNQLMDFRKFEQGKMELSVAKGDLSDFLKTTHLAFSPLARKKEITFTYTETQPVNNAWFDSDKLEKVLNNLLSNAFKYTQTGGHIDFELLMDQEQPDYCEIRVKDNGIGIPADKKEHIFERFYQAKQIYDTKIESTGIGLSFSKGLVEMLHGTLEFTSEENKGTTFTIKIPIQKNQFSVEEISENGIQAPKTSTILPENIVDSDDFAGNAEVAEKQKTRGSLLVVEDNIELRKYLKGTLKQDYKILEAEDGMEGMRIATENNPDLIVSDVMMPKMDGITMCKTLKGQQSTCHIPIILLTAKSSTENKIQGLEMGADAYLAKPFNVQLLKTQIHNILETREKLRSVFQQNFKLYPSKVEPQNPDEEFLLKVLNIIEDNFNNSEFTVPKLAQECGLSQIMLTKRIQTLTGMRPKMLIRSTRMKRAGQLLKLGEMNVSEVTYEVGFNDPKHFRVCFREEFDMTPSEYIKKHKTT